MLLLHHIEWIHICIGRFRNTFIQPVIDKKLLGQGGRRGCVGYELQSQQGNTISKSIVFKPPFAQAKQDSDCSYAN